MRASCLAVLCLMAVLSVATSRVHAHEGLREQITALTLQIDADPARADLYLRRGDLRRATGDFTDAHADLDRAARLDPQLAGLDLGRARLHLDEHRPADAVAAATRVLTVESRNVQARLIRARALAQLGNRPNAVADFSRAIDLDPTPDVIIERARLLEAPPADLEEALGGLEDGLRRIGPVVTLDLEALEIERRLRRYDAALRRIDGITARSPRKEQWLARRAALLDEAGRSTDALSAYEAALAATTALPPHIRDTRAVAALVSIVQSHIVRLNAALRTARFGRSVSR